MAAPIRTFGPIEVERIFLFELNPRHEPVTDQDEVIGLLCKDEAVFNLARSISQAGLNPLDLCGLVELPTSKKSTKQNYQVWEGNRRICAIKLLNDPDLAPADLRKDFAALAKDSGLIPIKKVNAAVFDDHNDLKHWMGVIHGGEQNGVGRKTWDAQQKARHFQSGRNKAALEILDAAERLGLISDEEREGKITTAQRFLTNSVVKEALGLNTSNLDDITFNRPPEQFKKLLGRFIADLKEGVRVTSRHNRDYIEQYGRKLAKTPGVTEERVSPQSMRTAAIAASGPKQPKRTSGSRKKPKKTVHVGYDKALVSALEKIGNDKLESLHYSLCNVRLEHAPLLTIGAWAFIESLAALAGKDVNTDFHSFFSVQRLSGYGLGDSNKKTGPVRDALQRIQRNGNTTKHHEISASFDGKQLANDFATITPLLIKTLDGIASKK